MAASACARAPADQFGEVGDHAVEIAADAVFRVALLVGAVERDRQVLEPGIEQPVEIVGVRDREVRTQLVPTLSELA